MVKEVPIKKERMLADQPNSFYHVNIVTLLRSITCGRAKTNTRITTPVLNRLVNMHFVRKEGGRYYLHPVDSAYTVGRIPLGIEDDRLDNEPPPYTRFALLHRGAEYFKQVRIPRATWKTLKDLEAQLAEFDLRCQGGDYDNAAGVLLEINDNYLLLWGHYRLLVNLHEQLQNKLSDPLLIFAHKINLGSVLYRMGQIRQAITLFEQALSSAQGLHDRGNEAACLGGMGMCYADLGQTERAIEYHQQALEIDRETGYRQGEAIMLGNLGNHFADTGHVELAIDHYKQAMQINRELKDQPNEALNLNNLASIYCELGQSSTALEILDQALNLAREIGYRLVESAALNSKGHVLVVLSQFDEAKRCYNQAVELADTINSAQTQSETRTALAAAHLVCGDLPAAQKIVEAARQYPWPINEPRICALLGVIHLRQNQINASKEAFHAALTLANAQLAQGRKDYDVLDIKGIALLGLELCGEDGQLPEAIASYSAARAIHKGAGVIAGVLRLLDALAVCDTTGMLAEARAAAAGEK